MVYRVFVEKKPGLDNEARALLSDAKNLLGINRLERVRLLNRYDAENISAELFDYARRTVFSEPQLDITTDEAELEGAEVFAVEYLPGQFDQRADSCAQCIALLAGYLVNNKSKMNLADYLDKKVFAGNTGVEIAPTKEDVEGFNEYIKEYQNCLPVEQEAVKLKK